MQWQTGESRVSRSAAWHQRSPTRASWYYGVGSDHHLSNSGGKQNAPPVDRRRRGDVLPGFRTGADSQRVRHPEAVPALRRRLSCTYVVSLGVLATHPMGAHKAAARWRAPVRWSCVRRSRWIAIMESWAPSESRSPDGDRAETQNRAADIRHRATALGLGCAPAPVLAPLRQHVNIGTRRPERAG